MTHRADSSSSKMKNVHSAHDITHVSSTFIFDFPLTSVSILICIWFTVVIKVLILQYLIFTLKINLVDFPPSRILKKKCCVMKMNRKEVVKV